MKSRISLVLLFCGLAAFSGIAYHLTRNLFKMTVSAGKPLTIQKATAVAPKPLEDAVIEVGNEPGRKSQSVASIQPRVTQYTSGQEPPITTATEPPSITAPIGTVTYISGVASVVDSQEKARLLTPHAEIFRMDRIETGPNSKLEIKLVDGTVISQGERSVILIEECVYIPSKPAACGFIMRVTRGLCRVATGLITDVNPNRFKVKARMATVGIRGCDLVFRNTPDRNDIYILDVGRSKSIEVDTTSDGSTMVDLDSGRELDVDNAKKKQITVNQPQNLVSIVRGKGVEERAIGIDEARNLISETSHMAPAHYELQQKPDGAVLKITPAPTNGKP